MVGNQIVDFADAGFFRRGSTLDTLSIVKGKGANIGEIYAIYLLDEYKRKDIGQALFQKCRIWFAKNELDSFVVWALKENIKARYFYVNEGGEIISERFITIGNKEYEEVCYLFQMKSSL